MSRTTTMVIKALTKDDMQATKIHRFHYDGVPSCLLGISSKVLRSSHHMR